jgi:predicted phosphodiesterase
MIIISDLHIKNSEAHLYGIREFFKWLIENYKNEVVVQLGDTWDSSSPHADLETEFIGYFKQFKEWHTIQGNHDTSFRLGSAIKHLQHHNNIFVYTEKTEVMIDNHLCLMLPWKFNCKEEYEKIEWRGTFCFAHVTNKEDAFANEFVDLSKIHSFKIYGHTHTQRYLQDGLVVGVPLPTRNLETVGSILQTVPNSDRLTFIKVPSFFEYETLEYGKFPENKHNILNIINAPSKQSVFDTYKGYHIRNEGISVLRTENDSENVMQSFEAGNIKDKFNIYSKENNIPKEIVDCGNKYLGAIIQR